MIIQKKAAPTALPKPKLQLKRKIPKQSQTLKLNLIPKLLLLQKVNPLRSSKKKKRKTMKIAIVGIDVILSDEVVGPDLPESHFAVAVPIRQHTGVYEKTKQIPYIVFRRTANSLIDEEDCLSIVTDV